MSLLQECSQQNHNQNNIYVSNRCVGAVDNGIFHKSIKGSRHLLRTPPAICLSVESLRQAEDRGASEIEIADTETGKVYQSKIEYFRQHAWKIQRGGYEPQLAMRLELWEITQPLEILSRAPKRGEVKHKVNK